MRLISFQRSWRINKGVGGWRWEKNQGWFIARSLPLIRLQTANNILSLFFFIGLKKKKYKILRLSGIHSVVLTLSISRVRVIGYYRGIWMVETKKKVAPSKIFNCGTAKRLIRLWIFDEILIKNSSAKIFFLKTQPPFLFTKKKKTAEKICFVRIVLYCS